MFTRMLLRSTVACLGAVLISVCSPLPTFAVPSGPAHQMGDEPLRIHDLGTLGGATSRAIAINERGQVVGTSDAPDGSPHVFVWTDSKGKIRDLGPGTAVDINNHGQVLGNDAGNVFLWGPHTGRRAIGALSGGNANATDLNDSGQLVGAVGTHAFRWDPRKGLLDLGVGTATAINERGQVAGLGGGLDGFFWDPRAGRQPIAVTPEGVTNFTLGISGLNDRGEVCGTALQAFTWNRRSGETSLNTLDAIGSTAEAINNQGMVTGRVQVRDLDVDRVFVWTRTTGMVDITEGGDFTFSADATGISDSGYVAGWMMTSNGPQDREAFVWKSSTGLRHLGTLGGDASSAVAVNNRGWVAGSSTTVAAAEHAVVWYRR